MLALHLLEDCLGSSLYLLVTPFAAKMKIICRSGLRPLSNEALSRLRQPVVELMGNLVSSNAVSLSRSALDYVVDSQEQLVAVSAD